MFRPARRRRETAPPPPTRNADNETIPRNARGRPCRSRAHSESQETSFARISTAQKIATAPITRYGLMTRSVSRPADKPRTAPAPCAPRLPAGVNSTPEKMKTVPISAPVIDPRGLKACEKFSRLSDDIRIAELRNEGIRRRFQKRQRRWQSRTGHRERMHSFQLSAAGQNRKQPRPYSNSPITNPLLYPAFRMRRAAGIASTK